MQRFTLLVVALATVLLSAQAFAPTQKVERPTVSLSALITPPAVEINVAATQHPAIQQSSQLNAYVSTSLESSSVQLSLKERPPPPTPEEIARKKRNFNLWFWGGGFVAPFIATIYYFGPKFWKY